MQPHQFCEQGGETSGEKHFEKTLFLPGRKLHLSLNSEVILSSAPPHPCTKREADGGVIMDTWVFTLLEPSQELSPMLCHKDWTFWFRVSKQESQTLNKRLILDCGC